MRKGIAPVAGLIAGLAIAALLTVGAPAQAPSAEISVSAVRARLDAAIEKRDGAAVEAAADLLAAMGGGLSAESQQRIVPFLSDERRQSLRAAFAENVQPVAVSIPYDAIPAKYRLVEGLAFDARTRRLFAGTVVNGRLLVRDIAGWQAIALPGGLGGVFGMALDDRRRRLWIANGVSEPVADRRSIVPGLVEIDVDTLQVVARHPMPTGDMGTPGDVAIGLDGTVYASDGVKGGIYRCMPDCTALEPLVAAGSLKSPQGMVPTFDRRAMLVADYARGLARVDLADGQVTWLHAAVPEMLDGIDGLVRDGGALFAIQNGTVPRRLLRITLNEQETAIDRVAVVEREHPQWGEPTLATMVGGQLVYVADGQWEVYGPGGTVKSGAAPRDTALRILPRP
ncbi:SMP-30/gluconolactonase/LRE family protein [Sphingobium sp. CR28]|uniref:SMP-30/gluconolactonase/LRE family protein n=1 Tax=Sphingobium sp. CR28 TaxID=3400272 RepID=UPI003FED9AA1